MWVCFCKDLHTSPCSQFHPQEVEGPYAWRRAVPSNSTTCRKADLMSVKGVRLDLGDQLVYPKGPKWSQCLPSDLVARPSLQAIVAEAASMGCISFRLPSLNALAGGVLRHATKTLDLLLATQSPMIFKLGYTHSPTWRWSNGLYGYQHSRENWSAMLVMYISDEPGSVGMLEAALIDKYHGTSPSHPILCITWSKVNMFPT